MTRTISEALRDIVDRHGRGLLEEPRRFESLLRDSALANRDIAGLVAALKDGVPKRLSALPGEALNPQTLTSIATELSERSGLRQDIAQGSVDAWVHALQLGKPVPEPQRQEAFALDQKAAEEAPTIAETGRVPEKGKTSVRRLTAPSQAGGSTWKTVALLPPVIIAGALAGFIIAGIYYAVAGLVLSQLFQVNANLGVFVGAAAGAIGIPIGVLIAIGAVQSRRGFDRRCWIFAVIFGLPFIVLALLNLGNALVLWGNFKAFGFVALFGFIGVVERLDQMLGLKLTHE